MNALWALAGFAAVALTGCAFVAARAGRRVVRLLARSTETVRRLSEEDALTALPNHCAMLKRLEEVLANRRSRTVVLARVDLDAFREVNEKLGQDGGDAMLVDLVAAIIRETGIAASRVVLEVTEGVVIDDTRQAQPRLEALRARCSHRTGRFRHRLFESQLPAAICLRSAQDRPRLRRFAGYFRQFRRHHPVDRHARSCARHEGARGGGRDRQQRVVLRLAGCDELQGRLFAMPAPAAEIDCALARPARPPKLPAVA